MKKPVRLQTETMEEYGYIICPNCGNDLIWAEDDLYENEFEVVQCSFCDFVFEVKKGTRTFYTIK